MAGGLDRMRLRGAGASVAACAAACLAAACGGCGTGRGEKVGGPARLMMEAGELVARLEPVAVRVHPLTHVEANAQGREELVCHVELTDRAGDSVKWPMVVRVEARRVSVSAGEGAATSGGGGTAASDGGSEGADDARGEWEVDLTGVEAGAGAYDRVSRTYVVRAGPVDGRVRAGADGDQREWLVRVWVTLPAVGEDGAARLASEAKVRG